MDGRANMFDTPGRRARPHAPQRLPTRVRSVDRNFRFNGAALGSLATLALALLDATVRSGDRVFQFDEAVIDTAARQACAPSIEIRFIEADPGPRVARSGRTLPSRTAADVSGAARPAEAGSRAASRIGRCATTA